MKHVETSTVCANLVRPWKEEASKPGGSSAREEMRAEKLPKAGWFCVFTITSTERGVAHWWSICLCNYLMNNGAEVKAFAQTYIVMA